jgi:hypothetical protein
VLDELLPQHPLLTIELLERFHAEWARRKVVRELAQNLEETAHQPPSLDELSDEEIREQLQILRAQRAVSRR